jgi:molybdate transport system substrate-binding protein
MGKIFKALVNLLFALTALVHTVNANAYKHDTEDTAVNRPLTVAVASNFKYTLEQIIASSDYWSTQNVRLVTGSSGMLYAQIMKGAPFDVFLSADTLRPNRLVQAGLGKNAQVYALGRLVLWPLLPSGISVDDAQNLRRGFLANLTNFKGKLAIANPQLAPFGKAALEAIKSAPALHYLTDQLVKGTNINQAFQFVDSGNAQAGILAESLLIQAGQLLGTDKYDDYVLIPKPHYNAIEQSIVVLKRSSLHPQSELFMRFLLSEKTQKLLPQYGYDRP